MRFRPPWRLSSLLCALSILVIVGSTGAVRADTDDDIHISAERELFVLYKYPHRKGHKALAVGPSGYWGESHGVRSAAQASKSAIDTCNRVLRTSKFKSEARRRCVLFAVNDKRTGKATPIGIPFGTVPAGDDLPWQFGKEWRATSFTKRGTMLLGHGCNGHHIDARLMAWVNYYRAAGFRVIMPNSFAEPRDPDTCPPLGENRTDEQTRNLKLRIAQMRRTIAGVRKKYPGEPLYLHGFSEGGYVVQALDEKVDGVIVTGAMCGFGYAGVYRAAKGVPLLLIAGTKDFTFPEATSAKALARFCRRVTGTGPMTFVSIAGMDHYAAIWWPGVETAIRKFLEIPPIRINRPSVEGVVFPPLPTTELDRYEKARPHKAIAANKFGTWYLTTELGSKFDAEEDALFGCDDAVGADVYLDTEHMHACVLVDVNSKRLVK